MQALRHLSTREIERRVNRTNRRQVESPTQTAAQRIVVRPDPDTVTLEEELYLLGALESLKRQHDKLKIVYAYHHEELRPALKGRWFLADTALCGDCDRFFAGLVGTDFGLTIPEPDPQEAATAEQAIYEREYQRCLADIQAKQAAAHQAGAKDLVIPEPEHFFQPMWHKTNGYFWQISEMLGLVSSMPKEPLRPFHDFPQAAFHEVLRPLQRAKLTSRPFVVFDFSAETEILPMMGVLGQVFPQYELVSLQEIARVVPSNAVSLTAVFSHDNCRLAVGPPGAMLAAAWAGGVPNILCLYTGGNFQWDGIHAVNTFSIARDRLPDDRVVASLTEALRFVADKAVRKGVA